MSYKENINKIDSQIKNVFSDVKIDSSDYRQLSIRTSHPLNENTNKNLEMQIFVDQKNINEVSPILEWGYYTDSNKLDNVIKFVTPISSISNILEGIIKENRLNKKYLEEIKVNLINESESTNDVIVDHINQTYELTENRLKINESKLKTYFKEKYGMVLENLNLVYFDVMSGQLRGKHDADNPIMGDEAVLEAQNISSSINRNITPKQWVDIENDMRKIPFVEDVNSNTHTSKLDVNFSTKIFVEKY